MPNDRQVRVLLLEDNPADVLQIEEAFADLTEVEYRIEHAERLSDALALARDTQFSVALLDLGVPDSQGLETFKKFYREQPSLPVLVLTALNDTRTALLALHEGAQDYLLKNDIEPRNLGRSIRYSIERNGLNIELQRSRDRLRMLAARLESIREQERIRISREFHDQLGQKVSAMKMDLAWLGTRLESLSDATLASETRVRLQEAYALADSVIATVQRIAFELRPSVLDHLGLLEALREEARQFEQRTKIRTTLRLPDALQRLGDEQATMFFRVYQEMLTNVVRHAEATEVSVTFAEVAGQLQLTVADDGVGMDPEVMHTSTSLGLLGIHERAMAQRGTLHIDSARGDGTRVTVAVPTGLH